MIFLFILISSTLGFSNTVQGPAEILGSTDVLSNQLSLTIQFDGCPCSYIIQYNIQGSSEITNNTYGIFDNHTDQMVIGLKSNTKYEFRVVILFNSNGPTGLSAIYTVRTSKDIITEYSEYCPGESIGTIEYKGVYSYDRSKTGTVIKKNCTYGSTATNKKSFIRECKPSESSSMPPALTTPNLSHCLAKKKATQALADLENKIICGNVGQTNCISIRTASSNLSSIVSSSDVISIPEDVSLVSKIIESIAQNINTTTTAEEAQTVLTDVLFVASEVSEAPTDLVSVAENTTQSADSMRNSLEVMGQHSTTLLQPGGEIKASSKDIGFVAAKVTRKNNIQIVSTVTNGNTLTASLDENRAILESEVLALMNVPESALPRATNISIYSFTFKNNALFKSKEGATSASVILSATINNQKIQNLQTPINITFKVVDSSIIDKNPNCSFWNETNNFWSTDGLTKGIKVAGKSYLCQTNHLTNFALIIDIAQTQSNPLVLQYITWIGCGISLAGLSLTVLSNCCLKKLRCKLVPRLLICLSLSLMCTILIFLFGVEETGSKLTCQVIAALLQYFLLASFSWMAVQGFNLYSILFKTLERRDFNEFQFFIRSLIACTGIPAIVVIVTASVKTEDYGGTNLCLVSGVSFYVTLLAPIALIIATNIIFLVLVLTELRKNYRQTKSMKNDKGDDEMQKMAKITISCSILLGMTWLFGVLAVGKLTLVFQYLFCIFNSLQGFFIFMFYTLTNKEVQKEWKVAVGWKTLTTSSSQTTENIIQNRRGKELGPLTSSSA